VLNDDTPLKPVEVQGRLHAREHTLVSRATDVNGTEQPVAAELSRKKTFLQDNAQFPRKSHDRLKGCRVTAG
jgi:hypothetical protein